MKKIRMTLFICAPVTVALLAGCSSGSGDPDNDPDTDTIRISYQPAQNWALPLYIAEQQGWWSEVGLEVESMTAFPSGAPQVAAGASDSWDVGVTGSVPALTGATQFGLQTIGVADREERIVAVMASAAMADRLENDKSAMKGVTVPVALQSAGEWAARGCLEGVYDLAPDEYNLVNLDPAAINAAAQSGQFEVFTTWAPNTYTLEENADAEIVCTAEDAGIQMTANIVATPDFGKENPEAVAKFLAVYSRGVAWIRENPEDAVAMFSEFAAEAGVTVAEANLERMLNDRPQFTASEQVELMEGDRSDFVEWSSELGAFAEQAGIVESPAPAADYIEPSYMTAVVDDPDLSSFAELEGE